MFANQTAEAFLADNDGLGVDQDGVCACNHRATRVLRQLIASCVDLFEQLAERLSRSGAKTTTLDFENEDGYRAYVADFARRHGFVQAFETASGVEGGIARQLSFIETQRARVAALWQRRALAACAGDILCARA